MGGPAREQGGFLRAGLFDQRRGDAPAFAGGHHQGAALIGRIGQQRHEAVVGHALHELGHGRLFGQHVVRQLADGDARVVGGQFGVVQHGQHAPGDVGQALGRDGVLEVAVDRVAGLAEQVAEVAADKAPVGRLWRAGVGGRGLERVLGVEAAAVEEQGGAVGVAPAAFDLTDEDDVVAFGVLAAVEALEGGDAAIEQRRASRAFGEREAGPAVDAARREALGQGFLAGREHVDGVVASVGEHRHRAGRLAQAPEHQWRVERDRIERAGGQADRLAVVVARGDDGDAGREHAQRGAEVARREVRRLGRLAGSTGRGHGANLYENS